MMWDMRVLGIIIHNNIIGSNSDCCIVGVYLGSYLLDKLSVLLLLLLSYRRLRLWIFILLKQKNFVKKFLVQFLVRVTKGTHVTNLRRRMDPIKGFLQYFSYMKLEDG